MHIPDLVFELLQNCIRQWDCASALHPTPSIYPKGVATR
jgi:hypothetical protein